MCGGCTSTPCDVLSGVPQGSVLGALLFFTYINDITNELSSICRLYADDCILYRRIDSLTDVKDLQHDLQILELPEKKWKMSFNVDKCVVVSITLKRNPIYSSYHLHGEQLTVVQCAKYLGVSIDSILSFNQHVDNVCKKENSALSFVRRNFANCSCKIKESTCFLLTSSPQWNMQLQHGLLTADGQKTNLSLCKDVQLAL